MPPWYVEKNIGLQKYKDDHLPTFQAPGEYVLKCLTDDPGLWDDGEVTVTVTP